MADGNTIAELQAKIGADPTQAKRDLGSIDAAFGKTESAAEKAASKAEGFGSRMTKALGGALQFAAGGLIQKGIEGLAGSVGDFFSGAIDEAQGWNKAMAQTEAVIASTGGAAGLTAAQMGDLADSLSGGKGASLAADDMVLAGENMLATFTTIGKDVFPAATKTMVDMAQAMGTDVKSQAIALGKSLGDPVKGISALSRVGVTFTKQQKDMIKSLVDTGRTADAQKIILAELNREFGGSAKAAAEADGGMFKLSEQFANLKQTVGTLVIPILRVLVGLVTDHVLPPIQAFADLIADAFSSKSANLDLLQKLPGWLQPIGKLLGDLVGNFGEFSDALQKGDNPLAAFGDLIKNNLTDLLGNLDLKSLIPKALGAIGGFFTDLWAGLTGSDQGTKGQASFGTLAGQWILGIGTGLVAKVTEALTGIGEFFTGLWTELTGGKTDPKATGATQFGEIAGGWVAGIGAKLLTLAGEGVKAILDFFGGLWTGLTGGKEDPKATGATKFGEVAGEWVKGIGTTLLTLAGQGVQAVLDFFTGVWTGLTGGKEDPKASGATQFGTIAGAWVVGIGQGLLANLQSAWDGLGTFLSQFWAGLTGGGGGGGGGESESKTGGGKLAFATAAGKWVAGIGEGLVGAVQGALDSLGKFLSDFWGGLTDPKKETEGKDSFGTAAGKWVHGIADGFDTWLADAQKWQADFLRDLWDDLTNQNPKGNTEYKTAVGEWSRGIGDGFTANVALSQAAQGAFFQKIWDDLTGKHNEVGRRVFGEAVGFWVGGLVIELTAQGIFAGMAIQRFFQSIWDSLTGKDGYNEQGKKNFTEMAVQAIAGFVTPFYTAGTQLSGAISQFAQDTINGFKKRFGIESPSTVMAALGPDIAQGFINGIRDAWWRVTQGIAGLVAQIPEPIRKFLGIGSPSKLMFGLGADTGEGFNLGVLSKIPGLQNVISQIGATITGGVQQIQPGVISQISDLGGSLVAALAATLTGSGPAPAQPGKKKGGLLGGIVAMAAGIKIPDSPGPKAATPGGQGGLGAQMTSALSDVFKGLVDLVDYHAEPRNEDGLAARFFRLLGLLGTRIDQGPQSLKAYASAAMKGVLDLMLIQVDMNFPSIVDAWNGYLNSLKALVDAWVQAVNSSFAGVKYPSPPGSTPPGQTPPASLPPGLPPPPPGAGLPPGIKGNAAIFGGPPGAGAGTVYNITINGMTVQAPQEVGEWLVAVAQHKQTRGRGLELKP